MSASVLIAHGDIQGVMLSGNEFHVLAWAVESLTVPISPQHLDCSHAVVKFVALEWFGSSAVCWSRSML